MVVWEPTLDATGYDLQWRPDSATNWKGVTGLSSATTTYTITGLGRSTDYKVRLRAVAGTVAGEWFTTSTVTTAIDLSVPRFSVAWEHASYDEHVGEMTFIVSTTDNVPEAITVHVFVTEFGSMLPRDYFFPIPVGVANGGTTASRSVAMEVDNEDEPDSIVFARVIGLVGYDLGTSPTASATVRDDD